MTPNEIRQCAARTYSNPDKTDDMLRTALCASADRIERLESELRDIASELTAVALENASEMGDPIPRITWRLKSVQSVLKQ